MRKPLWEVMTRARYKSAGLGEHVTLAVAAEIRALRDWLVPEDAEPREHLFDGDSNPQWDRWAERQRLRALLTAEADRAERGEAQP